MYREGQRSVTHDASIAAKAHRCTFLDLNSATVSEIAALPGIGPALARKVVAHRESFGPFRHPAELMLVDGFSEARFEKLEGIVCAGGPP